MGSDIFGAKRRRSPMDSCLLPLKRCRHSEPLETHASTTKYSVNPSLHTLPSPMTVWEEANHTSGGVLQFLCVYIRDNVVDDSTEMLR